MNYTLLLRLLSYIIFVVGFAFVTSASVGLFYWDDPIEQQSVQGLLLSFAISSILALILFLLSRKADFKLFRKEALALIGLSWIVTSILGAIPYYLILKDCGFADALFESASGLTTTGASVFTNYEEFPRSLLFWRCFSQWIGGLGVVVLFVAILSSLGAGAKLLYTNEASGHSMDIEESRVQSGVFRIMGLYGILTVACAVLLYFAGMNPFEAICHAFTALSTGGFSTHSASVEGFNSAAIEWILIVFMALGGTSFFLLLQVFRKGIKECKNNIEFKVYYAIIIVTSILLFLFLERQYEWKNYGENFRAATFQVVSIMTTTGYSSTNFNLWLPAAKVLLLILMCIGGSSGSTAGGLKVIRITIGMRIILRSIEQSFRSHIVRPIRINGRSINDAARVNTLVFLLTFALIAMASFFILSIFEKNLDLLSGASAIAASLFNIGPGFNLVGPTQNFSFFSDYSKIFLSLLMIVGRLEAYAILVLFSPSLWKRFT